MPKARMTRTRQAVIRFMQERKCPVLLAELCAGVRECIPSCAYSTVFRLVRKLEREGTVLRIDGRERGSRYEWAGLPHHHHAVCTVCGRVTDLDDGQVGFDHAAVEASTGFTISRHSIELEGTCAVCRHTRAGADAPGSGKSPDTVS